MVRETDKTYTLWLSATVDIHSGTELILVPDILCVCVCVCWVQARASITSNQDYGPSFWSKAELRAVNDAIVAAERRAAAAAVHTVTNNRHASCTAVYPPSASGSTGVTSRRKSRMCAVR